MVTADRETSLRRRWTITYYFGFVGLGLMDATLGPTLPWLAARASMAVENAGILFAARSLGYMLGSLVAGRYYDRAPGHRIMAAGLLCTAATLAPVPSLTALGPLILAFAFTGAGAGALDVGGNTLLAWVHGDRVGPFLNGLHFFFGVGSFMAPALIAQAFAHRVGLQWAYWLIAGYVGIIAIFLIALPSPPRRIQAPASSGPAATRDRVIVVLVAASLAAYVGVELGFGGWIFTYATERRSMVSSSAANLTSVFWGSFMIGRLVSIPVMSRLARREGSLCRVLEAALAGGFVALAIFGSSNGERALWTGTAALGFSIGPIFPTLFAVAEQRLKLTGRITSFFLVGAGLGAMLIPWLIGLAMRRFGTGALLPSVGVSLGLMFVLYLAMSPSLHAASVRER